MAYYIDLFSPETYEAFTQSDQSITGFSPRQKNAASRIRPGDKLVCYVTKVSRWAGILEVTSEYFEDSTPVFYPEDDPFVIRFRVKPQVWLPMGKAVPIHEDSVWKALAFTQDYEKSSSHWTGKVRNSLNPLSEKDGRFLEGIAGKSEDRWTRVRIGRGSLPEAAWKKNPAGGQKWFPSPCHRRTSQRKRARDDQTIRESLFGTGAPGSDWGGHGIHGLASK